MNEFSQKCFWLCFNYLVPCSQQGVYLFIFTTYHSPCKYFVLNLSKLPLYTIYTLTLPAYIYTYIPSMRESQISKYVMKFLKSIIDGFLQGLLYVIAFLYMQLFLYFYPFYIHWNFFVCQLFSDHPAIFTLLLFFLFYVI